MQDIHYIYPVYPAHRHKLRFCRTSLQAVLSVERLYKPFYRKFGKLRLRQR